MLQDFSIKLLASSLKKKKKKKNYLKTHYEILQVQPNLWLSQLYLLLPSPADL